MSEKSDSQQTVTQWNPTLIEENIRSLLFNEDFSDVTFIVEGHEIPAHRNIVASSCEYFRALLYGGFHESLVKKVQLPAEPIRAFKLFLEYVYTGRVAYTKLDDEAAIDLLRLSHRYDIERLHKRVCAYFQRTMSLDNIFNIYEKAHFYRLETLKEITLNVIDCRGEQIIQSEFFLQLSPDAITEMLSRKTFYAPEMSIFEALWRWYLHNKHSVTSDQLDKIVRLVRFQLLTINDMLGSVLKSRLLEDKFYIESLKIIRFTAPDRRECRYRRVYGNVATQKWGAMIYTREDYLPVPIKYKDDLHLSHDNGSETGITVILNGMFEVNCIKFRLHDTNANLCHVLISRDEINWKSIINDQFENRQRVMIKLHFEEQLVRLIRIVGKNRNGKKFVISNLKVTYSDPGSEWDFDMMF